LSCGMFFDVLFEKVARDRVLPLASTDSNTIE
jgi:hypothetical protein